MKRRVERLEAEPGAEEGVERGRAERELAGPEPARVREREALAPSSRPKTHARVRRLVAEQQRAGHPQVHEQERLAGELPDQVLAAPPEPLDARPSSAAASSRGRDRVAPARVEHAQLGQRAALDVRREVAADRLDLGQLGHRRGDLRSARLALRSSARRSRSSRRSEMPSAARTARSTVRGSPARPRERLG